MESKHPPAYKAKLGGKCIDPCDNMNGPGGGGGRNDVGNKLTRSMCEGLLINLVVMLNKPRSETRNEV
jgi:hypothetical protein